MTNSFPRAGDQRYSDFAASGSCERGCAVACDAGDRAARDMLCGMEDPDVYGCAAGGEKRVKPERVFGVFPAGFHKKIVL